MSNVAIQQVAPVGQIFHNPNPSTQLSKEESRQYFMEQFRNHPTKPIIEIGGQDVDTDDAPADVNNAQYINKIYYIAIHNLPSNLTREDIDNSFIGETCHKIKHLYSDGDSEGKKTAQQKLRDNKPLENNSIRMCLTYVYFLGKSEQGQELEIQFLPSFTEPPKFIERRKRSTVSDEKIAALRRECRLISANNNKVVSWRKMTKAELDTHIGAFVSACYEEISLRFKEMYQELNTSTTAGA